MFFKSKGYSTVDELTGQLVHFLKAEAVALVYRQVFFRQIVVSFSETDSEHWRPYSEELRLQLLENLAATLSQGEDLYQPDIVFLEGKGKTCFSGSFEKEHYPHAW